MNKQMGSSDKILIWRTLETGSPSKPGRKRLRVSEVNPHLICVLCGGYYIDATTITECLHTFCKTCIVGYLEASKYCPVCDNLVHKTKPHLRLRPDHTLQDLVYKLVPGLFQDEISKRREFYKEEIQSGKLGENGVADEERERIIYSADEQISLVLELSPDGSPPCNPGSRSSKQLRLEAADRRYLLCPGNIPISHLKKFIKMKFNLCDRYQVDFYHTDETLCDQYTLVDVAYIYSWRRKGPLRLYYTVYTNPAKKFKIYIEDSVPMETELDSKLDLSDSKAETSGYVTDDDRCLSELEKSVDISIEADKDVNVLEESDKSSCLTDDSVEVPEDRLLDSCDKKPLSSDDVICEVDIKDNTNKTLVKTTDSIESTTHAVPKQLETNSHESCTDKLGGDVEKMNEVVPISKDHMPTSNSISCNGVDNESAEEPTDRAEKQNGNVQSNSKGRESPRSIKSERSKAPDQPNKVEISTCTSPVPPDSVFSNEISKSKVCNSNKSRKDEDDISEPVVSSTQNTQGCQTEPTEESPSSKSNTTSLHSSEVSENSISEPKPNHQKTTVDKSCETDNIVLARQMSCESVSVSTETDSTEEKESERSKAVEKGKVKVDCSTDVFDFPDTDIVRDRKCTVACMVDMKGYQNESNKRKTLSVDCSTGVDDIQMGCKRKSDGFSSNEMKLLKKTESKGPRRSYSYGGHLSAPQPAYLSEPLSPTKITLKVSAPKSPVKNVPRSPSRAEPSGFQSQYQSFVMELPDTSYKYDEDAPNKLPKAGSEDIDPYYKQNQYQPMSHPISLKKSQSKSSRPRGRPPKVRNSDELEPPKEKKHKSRSHSPKHRKHSDKHADASKDSVGERRKSAQLSAESALKSSTVTPYSWINKLDTNNKYTSEKKYSKSKSDSSCGDKSDLKIPKQVLIFSNGQYTLSTASSSSLLKQSSPISPPKTVSAYESSISCSDKPIKTEKVKEKKTAKLDSSSDSDRKEKKPVIKISTSKSDQSENPSKYTDTSQKKDIRESLKIDSNQNRILSQSSIISSSAATSLSLTPSSSKISISIPNVSSAASAKNEVSKNSSIDSKVPAANTSSKIMEYRHQSPFFASISGAKLSTPHRSSTHLNIPNLSSHFSGTHHLYTQGRYGVSRQTPPLYRSLSTNDKHSSASPAIQMTTSSHDMHRIECLPSPCGYLSPFPPPYLGLAHLHHSHLMTKLPPAMSSISPDSTKTSPPAASYSPPSSVSSSPLSNSRHSLIAKSNIPSRKSINTVISAIKERAKKESNSTPQEQLNGIDLSTKSSRQSDKSNAQAVDKPVDTFAFTDEDSTERVPKDKRAGHVPFES